MSESSEGRPLNIKIDMDAVKKEAQERALLEFENSKLLKDVEELKEENLKLASKVPESGRGVLPASLNSEFDTQRDVPTIKREFEGNTVQEAHAKMIDFLRSSKNPEDKALLEKLWNQSVNGMRVSPEKTLNFSYSEKIETDETGNVINSPIKKVLERQNAQARRT